MVVLVAPHTRAAGGVYDQLLEALGLEMAEEERAKPPCCDKQGRPPAARDLAIAIADAIEQRARGRRRGR
ncbi:MAG: hypothetical protein ACRD1K_11105 [Acidimicrobiales bacterium]